MTMDIYDVTIIGGGPAGLAAGIYASRAALKTVLVEKGMTGGLAATTEMIENYPGFANGVGGPELVVQMDAQARRFGLHTISANASSFQHINNMYKVITDDGDFLSKTIIIATGAEPQKLNVPGEQEFHGRGVSYCATCDGAFFKNKTVAVIGGGDSAIEEAIFLTKFAEKVLIVHRRGELRATKILQQRAMNNDKISFFWHSIVEQIKGDTLVKEIVLKNVADKQISSVAVDGVFVYVGTSPVSSFARELVKLDEREYILADDDMKTSAPGIFAAGDVRKKSLRQVVTAVADGAIAAVSAEKYIAELE